MPWTAPGGCVYHGGDFRANLDRAADAIDMAGFAARRAESARRGRLRGIAATPYVENDGGAPADYAKVEAHPDGTVTVFAGTQNFGMGHETVYAQIAADRLGIDFDAVRFVDGDTARVKEGFGSHGSRSMRIGGTACVMGADAMIERGRGLAAEMLEAASADVGYDAGVFSVEGTNRSVALAEVAGFAAGRGEALNGERLFTTGRGSLGNGAAACEVEIDPETGAVAIVRYVIVCDTGRTINPMLAEGQLHGGAAQGLGQAVLEQIVYDPETGQTLTGSLMDYAIPRADDLPALEVVLTEVAETDNPLGVKGIGEGATTMMRNLFRQRVSDVGLVLHTVRLLGADEDTCRTSLRSMGAISAARELANHYLCGLLNGRIDGERVGIAGHSLGAMTAQLAANHLPGVNAAIGFNNAPPFTWTPEEMFGAGEARDDGGAGGDGDDGVPLPVGSRKPVLIMIGDEDAFVQRVFAGLFQSAIAAAGGDPAVAFPLAPERAAPERMENPQPVALSAWRRAVSDRMLVIVRDTDHFTIVEDFARMFPWPKFQRGELPFGPTPERTRKPTGAQAFGPPSAEPGEPYTQLGWTTAGEAGEVYLPHVIRDWYAKSWFDWYLKGEREAHERLRNPDPFGTMTSVRKDVE